MEASAEKHKRILPGKLLVWFIVLCALSFLVIKRHQHTGYFNWRTELWGDPAGYYVYQPALFLYDFKATRFPEKMDEKTGFGFTLERETDKVVTRYTYGVSLLQTPFFLIIHAAAKLWGLKADGFSGIYHWIPDIASIFYSLIGLFFLWHFLISRFNRQNAFWVLLSVFLGTNLIFYSTDNTGASHIYSFALFAALLFLTHLLYREVPLRRRLIVVWSLLCSLVVLIRPTNAIFVAFLIFLDCHSLRDVRERVRFFFRKPFFVIVPLAVFAVVLPQMLYWKYLCGKFIYDSYAGYGFTNWASPQIKEFLFSTNNGMLLYNPLYLLVIAGTILMLVRRIRNGAALFIMFWGMIYIFSSWFVFSFGCGFGSRNFVEYTTVFSLPLGYLYENSRATLKKLKPLLIALSLLFILINLKLFYSYNKCFEAGDWNFKDYAYLLQNSRYREKLLYLDDQRKLGSENEYSQGINIDLKEVSLVNFRRAVVAAVVKLDDPGNEARVVLTIEGKDSVIYWNGCVIRDLYKMDKLGTYQKIICDYWLPLHYSTDSRLLLYIWNSGKQNLEISKLKIKLN